MKGFQPRACTAALGAVGALAFAPVLAGSQEMQAVTAHGGVASTSAAERALRAKEELALGPAHAAEHAQMRARARSTPGASSFTAAAVAATPAEVGQWQPKFSIPGVAVHAVMLRTGKILYFTGTTQGRAYLLDPVTRTTRAVHPPRIPGGENEPANIFCAGQSFLDDGTVLVMGGTVGRREGLKTIFTFDPIAETWRQQADMRHGRWYPTQVLLADGRTVVLDGLDERGEPNVNNQIESYKPNPDVVALLSVRGEAGAPPTGGLYPHAFQMPSGRVLVAGPEPSDSWFFRLNETGGLSWEDVPNPARHVFGSGVLLPGTPQGSTRVALIGGVDRGALPDTGSSTPLPRVETFDEANPAAGWTAAPPLNTGRAHHNTVQLPDSTMVTVGGGYGILNGNRRSGDPAAHRNLELYDPATAQWRLGPAQDELRTYHSTALLLPDATVMSAGDDGYGGSSNDTAEIYDPPYLFRGPRPQILSAPSEINYGNTFTVDTSTDASKAVLVAPAAVTHANDMSQRVVPLTSAAGPAGKLTVTAPGAPALAPPTYYMLFVLNANGVPSVAKFVRLRVGSQPPPPPDTTISAGPPADTQSTSAQFTFSSDQQGATFRCRLDGGTPTACTSPTDYSGLSVEGHTFEVTAIGTTGTADPTPATRSWTVTLPPPDTTISAGPPAETQSTSAQFTFTSDQQGATFRCRIDGGTPAACTSPTDYSGLTVGPHTFEVTAIGATGKPDPTPATRSWTVNPTVPDTPPETSITDGPVPASTTTTARFEYASNEQGSTFACRLDTHAWETCSSPTSYSELAVGPHTFIVAATDPAGNTDPSPALWSWSVLAPAFVASDLSVPPPATTVLLDSSPPILGMAVKRRTRRIVVEATCRSEPCTATATGRILVPGTARTFKLRPVTAPIAKGSTAKLVLRISKRTSRIIRRASRKRLRVSVRIALTAKDSAGNAANLRRSFRLTG